MSAKFTIKGKVRLFAGEGGWHYVEVPDEHTHATKLKADRGLVPIKATIGNTTWKTSLMPLGDGRHFLALGQSVRKAENINKGDRVVISYTLRRR